MNKSTRSHRSPLASVLAGIVLSAGLLLGTAAAPANTAISFSQPAAPSAPSMSGVREPGKADVPRPARAPQQVSSRD